MAEFAKDDFLDDETIAAPLVMKKNYEELLATIKKVRAEGMVSMSSPTSKAGGSSSSASSTTALKNETAKLTKEQNELVKVQNQIAILVAKDTEAYRKQEQQLIKLKGEIKQKNALGEKEALQVNKLNSSLLEIEAALNANRVAYSNLRSEEERSSKTGQTLLKTIQDQKEAAGELREEMGQFAGNVGNYTGSILKANEKIKEQEKATMDLIAVQKTMDRTTDEGKKSYDNLNVAIQNNITQINVYRKETGMAQTSLKELDKASEESAKSTGNLGDALGQISPGLKSAYDGAVSLGKAFWSLVANPIGLILIAVAAAVAGLARYFTASSEGQDKWNKVMAVGSALLDQFLDLLEGLGKALVTLWESPKKSIKAFMTFLEPVINVFKELGQGIADIFSFKGTGNLQKALADIKKLAVNVWDSATEAAKKYSAEAERRAAISLKIAEEENKLRKDLIQDIVDDSITELKASKDLQIVHDKLRNTDEKRLDSLRDANQLLEDQAKGDKELAQQELKALQDKVALEKLSLDTTSMTGEETSKIINNGIKAGQIDYDNRKKIADLIVKVNNTEQAFLDGQKKRLAEEFTLVNEIATRRQNQIKAEKDALDNLHKWQLEDTIELNKKIIADEFSTMGEVVNAISNMQEAKVQLAMDEADKEKNIALQAAKDRVALTDNELKQIYQNKALSFDQQIALEDKFRTENAKKDQAYVTTATEIEQKKFAEIAKINDESVDLVRENVFTILQRDATNAANVIDKTTSQAMLNLEAQFADNGNLKEYYKKKKEIQDQGQKEALTSQLDYLKQEAANLEAGSQQRLDIEAQAAAVELQLAQNNNALKVQYETDLHNAVNNLAQGAADSALKIIDDQNAAEDAKRQERLQHIQDVMDAELAAAGNNEGAKLAIKQKAEAEQQKIRLQQAAADRKRAIFEKAAAVVSIAINTAKGVGQALGTYPPPASFVLAAITAALGIVQIAAVVSKPIPTYGKGTKRHKGGPAIIGDKGMEAVFTPDGKGFLSPHESTLIDLPEGSKVLTHEETMKHLAHSAINKHETVGNRSDIDGFSMLGKKIEENTIAIKNKKEQHWNISKQGMQAMLKNAETRSYFMDQIYR